VKADDADEHRQAYYGAEIDRTGDDAAMESVGDFRKHM
jgi:hypothetical protein